MVSSSPNVPASNSQSSTSGVKAARPDIVIPENPVETSLVEAAVFEKLGAQEIINIARHDLIIGQRVDYEPIKGITRLGSELNPVVLIRLQGGSDAIFNNFPIKLENKVPSTQESPVEFINNQIVVSAINLEPDEQLEIQILTYGDLLDDTIYEE